MARREPLVQRCSSRARRLALWLLFPTAVAWSVIQPVDTRRVLAQASRAVESEEQIKQLIVMLRGTIEDEKFNGAGVIVGQTRERLYIATAHHVVRKGKQQADGLEVQFKWLPGEWKKNVGILERGDIDLDLAVLAVDAREVSIPDLPWAALGDLKALKPKDRVFPIGFPSDETWFRPEQPHVVNRVIGQTIRTEGQLFPGNSGGALVTEEWHLIGLVSKDSAMLGSSFRIDTILDRIKELGFPVGLTPAAAVAPAPPPASSKPREARLEDADRNPANQTIYTIDANKDLLWYQHTGRKDGTYEWAGPKTVGNGWAFRHVFPGDDGVIYAITPGGELLWFRHDGRTDGTYRWAASEGKVVGTGWNVRLAFSGGGGVIYAVMPNGDLLWNRHEGREDGSFRWAAPTGKTVGNGWNFRTVFAGGDGSVYTISPAGELRWFKHDGRTDGTYRWSTAEGGKVVGVGWNVRHAFAGGAGVIYSVLPNGDLQWNRHEGREQGTFLWSAPTSKLVGNGWTSEHIFSGANLH